MNVSLTDKQKDQLKQMGSDNKRLFMLGCAQLVLVLMLSLCVWLSQDRVDSLIGDGGPWGRPALQSLDAIKPETEREAYMLAVFRKVIPLPIVAVKNSFIYSTLMWLFVLGLFVIGFARHQKKQLDVFQEIIEKL